MVRIHGITRDSEKQSVLAAISAWPYRSKTARSEAGPGDVGLLEEAPKAILFGDYAEQWLVTYVTVACKPSTGRIQRSIVRNHLINALMRETWN